MGREIAIFKKYLFFDGFILGASCRAGKIVGKRYTQAVMFIPQRI
jgi:hypothetical protein